MCKIVELRWSKDEITSFIKCNYDQLLMLYKNKFKKPLPLANYKNKSIEVKAEYLVKYIMQHTTSEFVVDECIRYYKKICEFNTLLKLELYNI